MMSERTTPDPDTAPPRPVADAYWVLPGRLLVGAHPGSRSRAQAMDRLRRFLEAGVTCFIDLTEPDETASYEALLPFATPRGRRIEYLREPVVDHGVPANRETMARILAMLDAALDSGHVVYLHCRAGIGRSATAAGCWLAERSGSTARALEELAAAWPQAEQSNFWSRIPETDKQVEFVLRWLDGRAASVPRLEQRVRGAWVGLALGDGLAASRGGNTASPAVTAQLRWTQHTALAACLAESLLERGRCDARDQVERYLRWQRTGEWTSTGTATEAVASPDVARALATYQWRGLPTAGSHDPRDVAPTSLPRVVAAATFARHHPTVATAFGAECARTTHQSPTVLEACRCYAALLVDGMQGHRGAAWLEGVPEPSPSPWTQRPLRGDVQAVLRGELDAPAGSALRALIEVRSIVRDAAGFDATIARAVRAGRDEGTLYGALAGTLFGLRHGIDALPVHDVARLAGVERIESLARRLLAHVADIEVPA